MYYYYLVYRINRVSTKGNELAKLKDVYDSREMLMGFHTKRAMQDFVKEWAEGFEQHMMLKPVS